MRIKINYADFEIDAKLSLAPNEAVALYGPSGSGKSSIIRAMAGLIKGAEHKLEPSSVGLLDQGYLLFNHLSVLENLQTTEHKSFWAALRAKFIKPKCSEFFAELLEAANLSSLMHVKPANLSGGQRQRAALCAVLASKPKYLLLDEPFSALDDENKRSLIALIKSLQLRYKFSIVLISHNASEVAAIANKIYLVENGRIKSCINQDEFKKDYLKAL